MARMRRQQAYPEILRPGRWTVRHQHRGGSTNIPDRELSAPLDDTPFARGVRLHELAHVRFSPPRLHAKLWRVDHVTVLAVEDARVNELVGRAGLGRLMAPLDDPAGGHVDPRDDLRSATLLLVAAHGTGAFERLWAAYEEHGAAGATARRIASRAIAMLRTHASSTYRHTIEAARFLDRALGTSATSSFPRLCCPGVHPHDEDGPARRGGRSSSSGKGPKVDWGELREVQYPPRPVRIGSRSTPAWNRCTDEGALLRAPHRLLVDGRIFRRRARPAGGTVLVDGSGSMSLDHEAIMRIVAAAPAATMARYDGVPAKGYGIVRILAREGRRVADEVLASRCCGSGNVIDGPALRWLATRPAPRVWVSDGHVTGVGDRSDEGLTEEARAICGAHGIVRVANAEGARKALRARASRGTLQD
jgi:hypothetical protein